MRTVKQLAPLLFAVVVLLTVFRVIFPGFLQPGNLIDIAEQISIKAILAFGMTLVILIGGIDLSVGAVVALVGTVTVWLVPYTGLTLAVTAGLGLGALIGAFNGVCAAKTRMPPFIITLAMMEVARGMALRFNNGTPIKVPASQELFLALGNERIGGVVPVPILVMAGAFVVVAVLLHRTRFGQHLYAIGGNPVAARFTGISLTRNVIAVYVLCATLAGLAGLIHASELYSADPDSAKGFELDAIAAVVVGGTSFTGGIGTLPGTLLGAVIIGILSKGLNQAHVHHSLQHIIKGLVILIAVYVDVRRRRKS
jgi:ribose transport system permease protein